jgi:iron complex transport system substrate-binding protein
MNHKRLTILFAASLLLLAACGGGAPGGVAESISIEDGLGRTVDLAAPAGRIVSLAPSNTEILYALGAGDQTVGRDEFSDFPAAALELPAIGGSFGGYNAEAILALEPDLVLAAEINTVEQVEELAGLGLAVFWLANPTTLEELYANLAVVAELVGRQSEADALVEELRGRVAAVDEILAGVSASPLVFYEIDGSDPNAPWTAGPGTFIDALIARAGGVNLGAVMEDSYAQISIEELVAQNPEIILLGDSAFGVTPESVAARSGWENITAVEEGNLFPFDDNLVSRPGPRLVDGLEALAALLHPALFE